MAESVVTVVARHIESMINDEANRLSDVEPELAELRSKLMEIKERLIQAEAEQLIYDEQVRLLQGELRQIAYQVEDVVDTIVTLESSSSLLSLPRMRKASRQQLRELKQRTEDVKKKLDRYVSKSSDSPKARKMSKGLGWQPSEGHLIHPEDDYVVGIDDDVNSLVNQLVGKSSNWLVQQLLVGESSRQQPSYFDVLAIVGMGGSGKTTLARKIYSHPAVKRHFDCQVWVTLTRQFNPSTVLLDILRQAADSSERDKRIATVAQEEGHHFDVLESLLQYVLVGKKCLVVLDDVWPSDSLSRILDMLIQHSEISIGHDKIIITSRNRVLSESPDTGLKWSFHETQGLSQSDSWKLFDKVASTNGIGLHRDFQVMGIEILKRCHGLPLAIVALANLLKTKVTIEEWERVFSQIEGAKGTSLYRPVNDILALSFDELPYYLKPCFLYLGLFPEGSSISAGMLIRMWIAEGFVSKDAYETLEDAARRCLKGLIDHYMVQVEKKKYAGEVTTIRVHDIMRDLCIMKARELDFLAIFPLHSENTTITSRRAAIDLSMHFTLPIKKSRFRSLVLFGEANTNSGVYRYDNKREQATLNLAYICENFKLLRVLDISRIKTSDGTLPREIGTLIHLRYLRMRSTNIRELPKSINKCRNLLTLDYWGVYADSEVTIPNVLWRLKCLRHLYLPNEMSRAKGELKLHSIRDLQTLWGVRAGDWMMKEMNKWRFSLRKLFIHGISSSEQVDEVIKYVLQSSDHLYALALDWYNIELENLNALLSKDKLKKLRLIGKAPDELHPTKFPNNLQKLELHYTLLKRPETMEALGRLRSLKFLRLSKDSYTGSEWTCGEEAFPRLEELKLSNLQSVDWRMKKGSMPCLKKLSIVSCLKLRKIPEGLQFINSLKEVEIERMPHDFCSRLQHIQDQTATKGQDFYIIRHIPDIKIRDACTL